MSSKKNLSDSQNQQGHIPYILAVAVSFLMQTQLSMKPAGLVAPPEISTFGLTRIFAPLLVIVVFSSQPSLVLRVMGHLLTSFLWLHWVAFMLITWSQYSSVSNRKVQLNFGTPLHRISIGTLFLTQFSPSGLSNGFPGFPGLLGFPGLPPGFFARVRGARLSPMKTSGTQEHPSPITVTLSPAWL